MARASIVALALIGCTAAASRPPAATSSTPPPVPPASPAPPLAPRPACTSELVLEPTQSPLAIERDAFEADFVPGETRDLWIAVEKPPGPGARYERVNVCAAWSVDPPGLATVNEGRLVLSNAAAGKVLVVKAILSNGTVLSREILVAAENVAAIVGTWREEARFLCGTSAWAPPKMGIEELQVRADGGFEVTWHPFESYVDYWGRYEYDAKSGAIALQVHGGNYVPTDVAAKGSARIENGKLVLTGVFLGSAHGESEPKPCAHLFAK